MPSIWDYLDQKYAVLRQDADTRQFQAEQAAKTNALTGSAAARLDTTRADLLPESTAADIAKTRADTGLVNQQATYYGPEAMSRIVLNRSNAAQNIASANNYSAQSDALYGRYTPTGGYISPVQPYSLKRVFGAEIRPTTTSSVADTSSPSLTGGKTVTFGTGLPTGSPYAATPAKVSTVGGRGLIYDPRYPY